MADLGDELGVTSQTIKWVWAATFAIVVLTLGVMGPWETLASVLENQGVGEDEATVLAFVAGYTLPLCLGASACTLLLLRGVHEGKDARGVAVCGALILAAAGFIASELGLGLLPSYESRPPGAPPYIFIPLLVIGAYVNSYGWQLMVAGVAIGVAIAAQIDVWIRESRSA